MSITCQTWTQLWFFSFFFLDFDLWCMLISLSRSIKEYVLPTCIYCTFYCHKIKKNWELLLLHFYCCKNQQFGQLSILYSFLLIYRQSHKSFFDKSDLFIVCMMRPLSSNIQVQEQELEAAQVCSLKLKLSCNYRLFFLFLLECSTLLDHQDIITSLNFPPMLSHHLRFFSPYCQGPLQLKSLNC